KIRKAQVPVLITALAPAAAVGSAGCRPGIGGRTAYRRLADPAFKACVRQAQLDVVLRTTGMLTGACLGSVKALVDLQNDASTPHAVRRGAARDILELGVKYRESADMEQRVAALVQRMADEA